MKSGFVKSFPYFFRLISRSMYLLILFLLLCAALIPAPLQEQANVAVTPNPAKSAWFLLWIQELVSWSGLMVYPVMVFALLFLLLPWLPVGAHIHRAVWFPREKRVVSAITVITGIVIVLLTVVAMFFRGANWSLAF
ncbi:MAG: selenite/tellurite reduction operon b-type cytochrome membrane protein ExtQ [Desulfuromonadaceae bacterium]|nr:selenite/tellurite reduction operon b-type cytochrome membrane protein ExtQ [Desulfuromonadaceae bacterium]MDD5105732.1 selenite/tellurite reduction operon b-type cytochrome membrane protein ExtQ [Desulfuromonadaceae bacterium]